MLPQGGQHLHQRRATAAQGAHGRPGRTAGRRWAFSCWPPTAPPDGSKQAGIPVERVKKLHEGHPNLLDYLTDGRVQLVMNTPQRQRRPHRRRPHPRRRRAAGVPCITTIQAADAGVKAMEALREEEMKVQALQDRFVKGEKPLQSTGFKAE